MVFQLTKTELLNFFQHPPFHNSEALPKGQNLTPAAVLIPIIDDPQGLMVLFTERTENLKNHPGQISFPGGRLEICDQNLKDTALRETSEEIGLSQKQITILGSLPPVISIAGFWVKPFIGLVNPPLKLKLDLAEVAGIFTTPLDFLLDCNNQREEIISFRGKNRRIYVIDYEGHRIWGMTAQIVVELREKLILSQKAERGELE